MSDRVRNAYVEDRVLSADPLRLVCILYETAFRSVQNARDLLRAGDISGRSDAISKGLEALDLLVASLNMEEGRDLSNNLLGLYLYMQQRLLEANAEQSDAVLAEVEGLLATLHESWAQLAYEGSRELKPEAEPLPPHARLIDRSQAVEDPGG